MKSLYNRLKVWYLIHIWLPYKIQDIMRPIDECLHLPSDQALARIKGWEDGLVGLDVDEKTKTMIGSLLDRLREGVENRP